MESRKTEQEVQLHTETLALTSGAVLQLSHRPLSSSFLGLPYRILNINHKKELLGAYGLSSSPR